VFASYLDAGIGLFILVGAFFEDPELEGFAAALPFRPKLVHLTVPLSVIEERLRFDLSAGRHDELREATAASGCKGCVASNTGPCRMIDRSSKRPFEILDWLGWT
jgi:hypothetical protein